MGGIHELPDELQQRLRAEIRAGERIAWVGQPLPGRFARKGFALSLFFIPWTAFSLFWIAGAAGFQLPDFSGTDALFPLFGLPFVLIGIGGLCTPLWLRRRALSMIYAVTDQRVITIEGSSSITVRSYFPADITAFKRVEHPDGSGDLVLRTEPVRGNRGHASSRDLGLLAIASVRSVEACMEPLLRQRREAIGST